MVAELVSEAEADAARHSVRVDDINAGKLRLLAGILGEGRHCERLPRRHELRSVALIEPFGLATGVAVRRLPALDTFKKHPHRIRLLLGRGCGAVHPVASIRRSEV